MEHPCVRVAATVVSDIKDKLSPKNEPPTTAATIKGSTIPVRSANSAATGTNATMVPTEVPIHIETTQAATNKLAKSISLGRSRKVRSTVAVTAPISLAEAAKAPANINIQTINSSSLLPAPREKARTRSSTL